MTTQPMRYFRVTFYCDECPNEFTDDMVTISHSWCPCCDKECQPDGHEALFDLVEDEDLEEVA